MACPFCGESAVGAISARKALTLAWLFGKKVILANDPCHFCKPLQISFKGRIKA